MSRPTGKCRCVNRAHKHCEYLGLVSHRSYTVQMCFRRNGKTSQQLCVAINQRVMSFSPVFLSWQIITPRVRLDGSQHLIGKCKSLSLYYPLRQFPFSLHQHTLEISQTPSHDIYRKTLMISIINLSWHLMNIPCHLPNTLSRHLPNPLIPTPTHPLTVWEVWIPTIRADTVL